MSQASAAAVATEHAEVIRVMERMLTGHPQWGDAARQHIERVVALALGEPPGPVPAKLASQQAVREVHFTSMDAATRRLWQRHRIVYDIDPDLWQQLGDTERDTLIPAGLFKALPHPDPYVALPQPMMIPIDGGKNLQQIRGFFVTGRGTLAINPETMVGNMQMSTHSPGAVATGLLIGGEVVDGDGRPVMARPGVPDMIWNRVSLNDYGKDTTVGTFIDQIESTYDLIDTDSPGGFAATVEPAILRAVSALLYLCSANRDLRPLPARPLGGPRKTGKGAVKPPKVVGVGYAVGAALRAWQRASPADEAAAVKGVRRPVRPHVRRAHFHTYRVGAGRVDTIVKWLPPIPINIAGDARQPTVVPIRKV